MFIIKFFIELFRPLGHHSIRVRLGVGAFLDLRDLGVEAL